MQRTQKSFELRHIVYQENIPITDNSRQLLCAYDNSNDNSNTSQVATAEYIFERNLNTIVKKYVLWSLKQIVYAILLLTLVHCLQWIYPIKSHDIGGDDDSGSLSLSHDYAVSYMQRDLQQIKEQLHILQMTLKDLTDNQVEERIAHALRLYDSDKIGLFDYAAEYAGGTIIATPDTKPYPTNGIVTVLGTEWKLDSNPMQILQPTVLPGNCFAFYGSTGRIRIKLGQPIIIGTIALEHNYLIGDLRSAPKHFQVLGLRDIDGVVNTVLLGRFQYQLNAAQSIQHFNVKLFPEQFQMIELQIDDNYGEVKFTCIYRFRVLAFVLTKEIKTE